MVQDKATGQMYILMEARLQELFKKPADDCTILAKMKAGLSAGKVMQYLLIDAIYYRTFSQCCGSGSARIRILKVLLDPDPEVKNP